MRRIQATCSRPATGRRVQEVRPVRKALFTIEEAAGALSIRPAEVRELMLRGELPVVRIGPAVRIPAEALERWMRRQADAREDAS